MKNGLLNFIEKVGNKLPHPSMIFIILAITTILISAILEFIGVKVSFEGINRADLEVGEMKVYAKSLLNLKGLDFIITSMVKNFTGFAPLGVVLVAMLGIGLADSYGFISTILKKLVSFTPKSIITPVVIFIGIMTNIASDVGYVVLIPLGGITFLAFNRHPIAGMAAAFAGVSAGFSANLLIGTVDVLLAGITQAAVQIIDPSYIDHKLITSNWYFMFVSTFILTLVGWYVTDKIVEPRLGKYNPKNSSDEEHHDLSTTISENEKKGLKAVNIANIIIVILLIWGLMPIGSFIGSGFFRNPDNNSIIEGSMFIRGIVVIISLYFAILGLTFGIASGKVKNSNQVIKALEDIMSGMKGYIVLAFFASQFIAYFSYSNMGTIIAVKGADFLENIGFTGIPLLISFILISAFINLFIGSASAKWAIMAPIFVPMMMRLDYSPSMIQLAYRIGDSSTNIITPLMPYFAIIIVFVKRYDKKSGIGTLISTMLPYSIFFLIFWTLLLVVWYYLDLPLGPGTSVYLNN